VTAVDLLRSLRSTILIIERHDRDLARQPRKCSSSVVLNLAEGCGCRGGSRSERYSTALGSAYEVGACLDVADAFGYIRIDRVQMAQIAEVKSVLKLLTRRR